MRRIALAIALALAANAHGDTLWRVSDSFWVWSGGSAFRSGNAWFGGGWDKFPGINPPWNPVAPMPCAPPPPVALPVPLPSITLEVELPPATGPCLVPPAPDPLPPISTLYIRIGDQLIPQVGRW